jgi:hypothetical protein
MECKDGSIHAGFLSACSSTPPPGSSAPHGQFEPDGKLPEPSSSTDIIPLPPPPAPSTPLSSLSQPATPPPPLLPPPAKLNPNPPAVRSVLDPLLLRLGLLSKSNGAAASRSCCLIRSFFREVERVCGGGAALTRKPEREEVVLPPPARPLEWEFVRW